MLRSPGPFPPGLGSGLRRSLLHRALHGRIGEHERKRSPVPGPKRQADHPAGRRAAHLSDAAGRMSHRELRRRLQIQRPHHRRAARRIAGGRRVDNALLAWRSVGSDWESSREQLSTRKSNAGGTRIETALSWAHRRISLARQNGGTKGHGIIILLSDGDPDRAPGELRGGVVLDTARALASEDIRVYSIIVNKASYRSGRDRGRLSDREAAAEQLMERVGSTTGGGTYRITATSGLLQIFLDIFRIVPTSPPILNADGVRRQPAPPNRRLHRPDVAVDHHRAGGRGRAGSPIRCPSRTVWMKPRASTGGSFR